MVNNLVWGNPDTQSFTKQQLRWAYYDDHKVQVHRHVWPIVERLFEGMGQMGVDVKQASEVSSPLREGFHLDHEPNEFLRSQLDAVHFAFNPNSREYLYVGTIEDAIAIAKAIAAEPRPESVIEDEPEPDPEPENRQPPWSGDPADPEFEQFLTQLLGVDGLDWYQSRLGIQRTGVIDYQTLLSLMPSRPMWFRPGHTGHYIKVLQAALIVRGYLAPPVTGVWGVEFSRALRKFQADYGIRPRMRVGASEWAALFDFQPPASDDAPEADAD
jgi:hypothetical protein